MLKKYNFYIHILIILVFSLGIRIFLLSKLGTIYTGDSGEYIEVIKNISNGYGFSRVDIADGQMKSYSNKPPLFFYASSLFYKILNGKLENDIIILNFLSSILTLLLWLYITYLITENKKITITTGWLLSINPNLIYNSLIENTNYSPLENKYPTISGIIKSLKGKEMVMEKELKLSLKITDIKLCKYLTVITLYTIKENPIQYLKLYIKNVINITTSSLSYLLIIDIFKNGFYEKQYKIFKEFILDKTKKGLKEVLIILPNLFFRFINLIFFIIFVVGIMLFYKNNNEIITFLIILFSYIIIVSSLALGYDRYRLPIEPLISIFSVYFLYNNIKGNICQKHQ